MFEIFSFACREEHGACAVSSFAFESGYELPDASQLCSNFIAFVCGDHSYHGYSECECSFDLHAYSASACVSQGVGDGEDRVLADISDDLGDYGYPD